MPKLSVGALTVSQITQRSANILFSGTPPPPTPPPSETFYIVTNNSEPLETNTGDNLTYGT
jgi:hypothetical protein